MVNNHDPLSFTRIAVSFAVVTGSCKLEYVCISCPIVCYTAVFSVVTQRSSWGGTLRDDTKNGCVADYLPLGSIVIFKKKKKKKRKEGKKRKKLRKKNRVLSLS